MSCKQAGSLFAMNRPFRHFGHTRPPLTQPAAAWAASRPTTGERGEVRASSAEASGDGALGPTPVNGLVGALARRPYQGTVGACAWPGCWAVGVVGGYVRAAAVVQHVEAVCFGGLGRRVRRGRESRRRDLAAGLRAWDSAHLSRLVILGSPDVSGLFGRLRRGRIARAVRLSDAPAAVAALAAVAVAVAAAVSPDAAGARCRVEVRCTGVAERPIGVTCPAAVGRRAVRCRAGLRRPAPI
jgi:hypothetical protein